MILLSYALVGSLTVELEFFVIAMVFCIRKYGTDHFHKDMGLTARFSHLVKNAIMFMFKFREIFLKYFLNEAT